MNTNRPFDRCEVFWHVPGPGKGADKIRIGNLARDGENHLYFAYDKEWLPRGIEISPSFLPLEVGTTPTSITDPKSSAYEQNPGLRNEFRGLPGPFYDSLPDKWGMKLLANHTGKNPDSTDVLEILCHRGTRCMGAFSYEPADSHNITPEALSCETLGLYCQKAAQLNHGIEPDTLGNTILDALEDSGGSAGGMRPKILLAIRKEDLFGGNPVAAPALRKLAGYDHHDMGSDFQPWLLKFDTEPDKCRGLIEKACADMAHAAGVTMPETTLIHTKSPEGIQHAHFATLRFDRQLVGNQWHRVHMHTAAGILRRDYNELDLDYTDILELTKILTGDPAQVRQVYVRAVFNVLAGNSDDHAKNHAFLLDTTAKWSISPAYDLTPSSLRLQPGIRSTSVLGNKRENIPLSTLKELAHEHGIIDPMSIIQQVSDAIKKWGDFSKASGIPKNIADRYKTRMNSIHPAELNWKTPKNLKPTKSKGLPTMEI